MKKERFLHIFTIILTGALLIAFADMAVNVMAAQKPFAAVCENHDTMVKEDTVSTKVPERTGITVAARNAAIQTTAEKTASAPSADEAQAIKTDAAEPCVNHDFGEWTTVAAATASDSGSEERVCSKCGYTETRVISKLTIENNSVWIPGANIVVPFALTELNQTNVDTYGAVCDLDFFKTYFGTNDIMVSGHRTNPIGALCQTAVGEEITLNLNGNFAIYTVVISEEAAITADGNDYIGVNTGTQFVTACYDRQALRMYTCYGEGRWIVIALKKE